MIRKTRENSSNLKHVYLHIYIYIHIRNLIKTINKSYISIHVFLKGKTQGNSSGLQSDTTIKPQLAMVAGSQQSRPLAQALVEEKAAIDSAKCKDTLKREGKEKKQEQMYESL